MKDEKDSFETTGRMRSRALVALACLDDSLPAVLGRGIPADVFLAERFRADRRLGSTDRRTVRDAVFAWYRWRGLVKKAGFESADGRPDPRGVILAFAADGALDGTIAGWAELAGISAEECVAGAEGGSPLERAVNLSRRLGGSPDLCAADVLPGWCAERIDRRFADWFQRKPSVWVRSNVRDLPERLEPYGISAEKSVWSADSYRLSGGKGSLYDLREYREGMFEVQDFSSQCIGLTAAPVAGAWFDACAGAGGKTLQLASLMKGNGSIFAADVSESRLEKLRVRAAKYPGFALRTGVVDSTKRLPENLRGRFDGVLADAPCSSSGRWRRNPELRWMISEEKVGEYARLQSEILSNVSEAVAPGGILVYATCSIFEEENEKQIQNFLETHSSFELDDFQCILRNEKLGGMLRVNPWDADCDASFAARLRRKTDPVEVMPNNKR